MDTNRFTDTETEDKLQEAFDDIKAKTMLRVDFVENSRRVMAEAFPRKLQSYELNFMEGHRNLAKVPRFPFGADVEGFTGVLFDEDGPTLIISLWIVKVLLSLIV
eukprot:TRINITY_DN601_c0_g1_i9.p1 TRINITY_DN601_c0_g1~~TRINITY_DN601_c0_g1_i9.p1  ORF type:complete len:105 (-),score=19.56 TRINITY_DN601_c0_g1_i9:581-895(-)